MTQRSKIANWSSIHRICAHGRSRVRDLCALCCHSTMSLHGVPRHVKNDFATSPSTDTPFECNEYASMVLQACRRLPFDVFRGEQVRIRSRPSIALHGGGPWWQACCASSAACCMQCQIAVWQQHIKQTVLSEIPRSRICGLLLPHVYAPCTGARLEVACSN